VNRMKQVVLGEYGGISDLESWRGGGGFNFFRQIERREKSPNSE
jgi:hypothetical protein